MSLQPVVNLPRNEEQKGKAHFISLLHLSVSSIIKHNDSNVTEGSVIQVITNTLILV